MKGKGKMAYKSKKGMMPEDEGDRDAENEEEKENDEEMEKTKKSQSLTENDLEKSLARLAAYSSEDTMNRKDELLVKAQSGDELNKSERDELFGLLGGQAPVVEDTSLSKSIADGMGENEGLQKALDVSEFLQEQHNELTKSLGAVADHIEVSDSRQHEFNLVLAKAVADTGNLVKAVSEKLGVIASQPARAPKSSGAHPLQKSFAGEAPSENQMSKSQILDTMESMQKSEAAVAGEDVGVAISKYEQFNQISRPMLAAVQSHRRSA